MNGTVGLESDYSEFAEVDPTGRYGRYNEILGKGASKTVYRAFDEYDGIEVAWNQVKLHDLLQSPEELERLYCEINLLKSLKHKNIMKFYISWVDTENRNINFVTEMFTSGTLRQYRLKHRRVNMRAVKHWCRQILLGLLYLHSHDPPIIHRDLKCDNIFVNGNQGEVKIGDLGLAAILRKSLAASCVGTPEFMAPEVYEEEYNELVDIYSFGMCVLEMVTFEYPYSECSHPAQIYKKVISGRKPESLYKVKDPEVRRFVEKCLASVSDRLSALELLNDPFLEFDGDRQDLGPFLRQPQDDSFPNFNSWSNGYSNYQHIGHGDDSEYDVGEFETSDMDFFACHEDEQFDHVDISIRGRRKEDEDIFLRLRIGDKEDRMRNIYFPFDVENDTALDVATEMVAELDMADQDVSKIADMIDGEIASLVPEWKKGQNKIETSHSLNSDYCQNCSSNAPYLDYASPNNLGGKNLQVLHCPRHGCAAVHGRFEEITYQVEGSEQSLTEGAPVVSSQSDGMHYADIWGQRDGPEMSSHGSEEVVCSSEGHKPFDQSNSQKDERIISKDNEDVTDVEANPSPADLSCGLDLSDVYENEIRQELRWLKAKYQIQLRELRDQQLGVTSKPTNVLPRANTEQKNENAGPHSPMSSPKLDTDELLKSFADGKQYSSFSPVHDVKRGCNFSNGLHNLEATDKCCSPHQVFTAKSFYAGSLLPQSLHRATSLPVGAIDF